MNLRASQLETLRERLRAEAAMRLIRAGRWLLQMPEYASEDFDTCVHCKAPGCEDGTVQHAPDCPSETGVFVVTLQEMWPFGPAVCDGCKTTLWPGDRYSQIERGFFGGCPVYEVACIGCVAAHELLAQEGK